MKRSSKDISPLLEYRLWLEAGKLDKLNFKVEQADPDVTFNSNLWRNFRSTSGLMESSRSNVSEAISTLYPISIPSASQVGSNTLSNYFEQNRYNMFKNDKSYNLAVARVENEATFMKYLRLKSELRNPPLDYDGSVLPPKNFKTYPPVPRTPFLEDKCTLADNDYIYRRQRTMDLNETSSKNCPPSVATNINSLIDLNSLEKAAQKRLKSSQMKLSAKENRPHYERVLSERQMKKSAKTFKTTESMVK